jgi:hypothetical protein
MKRQRFFHEFAIIFLLVITVGVIAFQTNLNFTGNAVLELNYTTEAECFANNGTWTNLTELQNITSQIEVVTGGNCTNLTYLNEPDCLVNNVTWTNLTELQNITSQIEVVTGGNCTGEETNTTSCTESWDCESWSECDDESQTRTCTDSNSCGTEENKPTTSRSCEMPDEEEESVSLSTTTTNLETTTTSVDTQTIPTCTSNMQCGDWQECINGTQIRICTDINKCNPEEIASSESQACVEEIKETCFDKIKNQDETGIDCGGKCKQCGFFTIVGNAVSGTVGSVFGNQTRIIIFSGTLLVIIAGFFVFRFFSKKRRLRNKSK